jgi:hypothetical protein
MNLVIRKRSQVELPNLVLDHCPPLGIALAHCRPTSPTRPPSSMMKVPFHLPDVRLIVSAVLWHSAAELFRIALS